MKKIIALLLITAMLIGTVPITIATNAPLNTFASAYDAYDSFEAYVWQSINHLKLNIFNFRSQRKNFPIHHGIV
jgi:uncharacterized membrane protein